MTAAERETTTVEFHSDLLVSGLPLAECAKGVYGIRLTAQLDDNGEGSGALELEPNAPVAQIEKSNAILTSIFIDLDIRKVKTDSEPLEAVLAQRLVKAGEQLEGEAVGEPLMVAALQDRLGETLLNLGHAKEAIGPLVHARQTRQGMLGPDDPDTLTSMHNLAWACRDAEKLDSALPLFEETLKLRKARLGADHPDTLGTMSDLAVAYQSAGKLDLALLLHEQTLKMMLTQLGADHRDTLGTMAGLASAYLDTGKPERALPLYEETLCILGRTTVTRSAV
jgi:tetratricopeptide (TPR) repeat protein